MKSKTSFFNKTIFLKNTALYWPLWGGYTIALLFVQPFWIWMEFYQWSFSGRLTNYTLEQKMSTIISVLNIFPVIIIVTLAAVYFGMVLFSYLYHAKTANMIHSLPVNKTELFGTNVISGLVFLIVPQILTFLISMGLCLSYGMTRIEYLAIWLLVAMAISFIVYSIVVLCAMFTGLLIALPIYVLAICYLSYWAYYMVLSIVSMFGYGVNNLGTNLSDIVAILSPLVCLANYVNLVGVYKEDICTGMEVQGVPYLAAYFIVAILFYAIAFYTYQKRHIETAGELISVKWLRPVFRWVLGISGGIFGSVLLCSLFQEMGIEYTIFSFLLFMLFLGTISYFGADMFVKKSFRVFKKKNFAECGIFCVALLATFFGLYGVAELQENYVPKKEDVVSGSITMGMEMEFEAEDIETLLNLHEEILEHKEICEAFANTERYWQTEYEHINLYYQMKNGDYVNRTYVVPMDNKDIKALVQKIEVMEREPKHFLSHTLCDKYDKVTEFGTGWVEVSYLKDVPIESEDIIAGVESEVMFDTFALTPEIVEALWQAVIKDAEAGTIIKYNIYSNWAQQELESYGGQEAYIKLEYRHPDLNYKGSLVVSPESSGMMTEGAADYESWSTTHLTFGADCENIIKVLLEYEVIKSEYDLYWGEEIIK